MPRVTWSAIESSVQDSLRVYSTTPGILWVREAWECIRKQYTSRSEHARVLAHAAVITDLVRTVASTLDGWTPPFTLEEIWDSTIHRLTGVQQTTGLYRQARRSVYRTLIGHYGGARSLYAHLYVAVKGPIRLLYEFELIGEELRIHQVRSSHVVIDALERSCPVLWDTEAFQTFASDMPVVDDPYYPSAFKQRTVIWHDIASYADRMLTTVLHDRDVAWARSVWPCLIRQGLANYTTGRDRARVFLRLIALVALYNRFYGWKNSTTSYMEWLEWLHHVPVSEDLILKMYSDDPDLQWAGSSEDRYYVVEEGVNDVAPGVYYALREGYGSGERLFAVLWAVEDGLDPHSLDPTLKDHRSLSSTVNEIMNGSTTMNKHFAYNQFSEHILPSISAYHKKVRR